ncbi:hypothetical protein HYPSUDRAFT_34362 [Hypholoma sublateritium FD-334 SS-4]|uniref:RED-like N-terminal domain-containing protein n=1 Tax=Hypholoma sublateritium (strain FD-334 SS-4) TaxID=945553 RepID=A0A0D2LJZ4_HYPSF|nr:hypothetical protein HYPSUDRAFT_34362 [Hypholoma sublateritium FD-334 SS-4]
MDQDSFRQLLQTPRTGAPAVLGGGSRSRISLTAPPPKKKTASASQAAFKPRTVKKAQDSKYRDRASERRGGDGNDYAHVEAVLEEFEKKNADEDKETVDEQRKYLGGDGEHSILVKGLDFALLEQNKARTVLTSEDVDALDEAYKEASSQEQIIPKKRTREDIIRELKEARGAEKEGKKGPITRTAQEEARLLEDAKQQGKFKPIGFKPIGSSDVTKKKRSKTDEAGGVKKKKKKAKVESASGPDNSIAVASSSMDPPPLVPVGRKLEEPEEPFDDDFDIFADAGEYDGLDFEDEDEGDNPSRKPSASVTQESESSSSNVPTRWIETDEPTLSETARATQQPLNVNSRRSPSPSQQLSDEDEGMESEKPMRLVPLSSSAVPSIKDLLAMDKAAGAYSKNKKRKDKKKPAEGDDDDADGKKKTLEEKVDRDYKRLKTYTDKKAAAEKS